MANIFPHITLSLAYFENEIINHVWRSRDASHSARIRPSGPRETGRVDPGRGARGPTADRPEPNQGRYGRLL